MHCDDAFKPHQKQTLEFVLSDALQSTQPVPRKLIHLGRGSRVSARYI